MSFVKIFSKPVLVVFFLIFTALLLTACSFPGSSPKGEVKLTWWGLWESPEIVKPIIEKYQSQNSNVKITYEKQSYNQYLDRLKNKISSGEGPDIFRFHNTWSPQLKNELSLLPSSVIDNPTYKKTFYKIAATDLGANNSFVGIPIMYDGLELFWNKDIFSAAGVDKPPATWDDLRTTAAKLTVKDTDNKIQTAGVAMGTSNNVDHFSDILGLMMLQNGANPGSPNTKFAQDALNFYTLFARSSPESRVWDDTLPASTTAFASGKLAMYFGPSWEIFEIKKLNPNLNFEVAPVPQLPGDESTKVSWGSYWVEGVSAKSTNQDEAWKFLKFISEKEQLQLLYQTASSSKDRMFGEIYPRPEMGSLLEGDPLVGAFVKDAKYARSYYMASATHDGSQGLNDPLITAYKDAIDAVGKGDSSESALKKVHPSINQTLVKFGLATPLPKE